MEPNSSLREAQHLAAVAAQRVWEELYVSKKPAVEEAFKISLGANTQHRAPSLELVRDPALKLWLQYVEAERRSAYRTVLEVSTPNQIQSKIQKVTGGLTRLTSRSLTMKSSKKEETANVMGRHSHAGNLSYCWADVWLYPLSTNWPVLRNNWNWNGDRGSKRSSTSSNSIGSTGNEWKKRNCCGLVECAKN